MPVYKRALNERYPRIEKNNLYQLSFDPNELQRIPICASIFANGSRRVEISSTDRIFLAVSAVFVTLYAESRLQEPQKLPSQTDL